LTNIPRILEEGPSLGSFDVKTVVHPWQSQKVRRPNQKRRAPYKPRKKRVKYYHKADKSEDVAVVELDSHSAEIAEVPEEDVITNTVSNDNDQMDHTQHCSDTDNSFLTLFDSDDSDSDSFEGFLPKDIFKD
jgi:hypothetical protein